MNELIRLVDVAYEFKDNNDRRSRITCCNASFSGARIYAITGQEQEADAILFSLLSGFIHPEKGRIFFNDMEMNAGNADRLRRDSVRLVMKNCTNPGYLSVLSNAMLNAKTSVEPAVNYRKTVLGLLAAAGLDRSLYNKKAAGLNPVEQQALAIVRALAAKPELLLIEAMDWGANPSIEQGLLALLVQSAHENGTCIVITTNIRVYTSIADEIWGFKNGILLPLKIA